MSEKIVKFVLCFPESQRIEIDPERLEQVNLREVEGIEVTYEMTREDWLAAKAGLGFEL